MLFLILLVGAIVFPSFADQLCEIYLNTCPEYLNDRNIEVPEHVIAIHPRIKTCDYTYLTEGVTPVSSPPSIVFIIDHSYSMFGIGNTYPGNDTYGTRFKVTFDLIDTIFSRFPNAEIGLVVFREVLYFDHRNNPHFVQLKDQGDQSYLPLLQLDQKIIPSLTGIQILKSVLQTDTTTKYSERYRINVQCVDLSYSPQFSTIGNTNINNAFAAANEALSVAKNPKNRQFIVFLSDGEPYPLNDQSQHGGKDPFFFQQGINTPTTFTVYLNNTEKQAPQSLKTMTQNIQNNGYSSSNIKSDIWVLQTNYDSLMSLCMNYIINPIITVTSGNPNSVIMNRKESKINSDSGFVFDRQFPLYSDTTSFEIDVLYSLTNKTTGLTKDTQTTTNFKVIRRADAILPEEFTEICRDPAELAFYYNNQKILYVTDSMPSLQIRFKESTNTLSDVSVTVTHTSGDDRDYELINLYQQNNTIWQKDFIQKVGNPQKDNTILEHQEADSIVAIYRNPFLPLDTIRIAIPFIKNRRTSTSHTHCAINNPLTMNSKVPMTVFEAYRANGCENLFFETGIVLALISDSLSDNANKISGYISIFDVAKNIVVLQKPMIEYKGNLFFIWNGFSDKGRKVGTGTYMALFDISDNAGRSEKRSLRIGVKR